MRAGALWFAFYHLVLFGEAALACNIDCQHNFALVLLHLSVPAIDVLQEHADVGVYMTGRHEIQPKISPHQRRRESCSSDKLDRTFTA